MMIRSGCKKHSRNSKEVQRLQSIRRDATRHGETRGFLLSKNIKLGISPKFHKNRNSLLNFTPSVTRPSTSSHPPRTRLQDDHSWTFKVPGTYIIIILMYSRSYNWSQRSSYDSICIGPRQFYCLGLVCNKCCIFGSNIPTRNWSPGITEICQSFIDLTLTPEDYSLENLRPGHIGYYIISTTLNRR